MEDTFPKLIIRNCERYGEKALAMRKKEFGIWKRYTWKDCLDAIKHFSLGLISLGLERGDRVCIIGENAPEYFWAQYGIQASGGIVTGVFSDSPPPEVSYIVSHSEAKFVIVDDQEQADKVLGIREQLPNLQRVIYWDPKGLIHYDEPILVSYREVLELGRQYEQEHPGLFERNVEVDKGEDLALLVYTSGTGGIPKGAMLTHIGIVNTGRLWNQLETWSTADEYVSFISPAWVTEQGQIAASVIGGAKINFPEETETVQENIREIGATKCTFSPRLWESVVSQIQAKMVDANPFNRFMYSLFFPVGYKVDELYLQDKKLNLVWRILRWLSNLIVFRPIKDTYGLMKVKYAVTGGAPLGMDSFRFLRALGINLRQIYAITEAGLVTFQRNHDVKFESVGPAMPETELRITDSGEILIRGSTDYFVGYYRNPEATNKVLEGGWFHGGDAGFIDQDGHLILLGRAADLFEAESGGGIRVSPENIEGRLKFSPYIRDAMVIGRGRPYVAALIQIDFETLGRWAERKKLPYTTFSDLSQKQEIYELTRREIERMNRYLPPSSRIQRYAHLHKEFDADEAELTRSKKLRRGYMEERYKDLIDSVYVGDDVFEIKSVVKYRDGREGTIRTSITIVSLENKQE